MTNSASVYNEGENLEQESKDFQSGRGRTRGGSGNDIFYASMDQNATMGSNQHQPHQLIPMKLKSDE